MAKRQRKDEPKLQDFNRKKTLIEEKYINQKHPVSTLTYVAQHLAGKKPVLQTWTSPKYNTFLKGLISNQLAFNFANKTFVNRELAQVLSRSLSAFSRRKSGPSH